MVTMVFWSTVAIHQAATLTPSDVLCGFLEVRPGPLLATYINPHNIGTKPNAFNG